MSKQRAALTGSIFQKKGEAAPAAVSPVAKTAKPPVANAKRVALTVKLEADTYERLRTHAFNKHQSHQELIEQAVLAMLRTEGIG